MDNVVSNLGTHVNGNDLYPGQGVNAQPLDAFKEPVLIDACTACQILPQPQWALGSCEACSRYHRANARQFFPGRALGERGYSEDTAVVLPANYPPRSSDEYCAFQNLPGQYGSSWQSYSTNCSGYLDKPPPTNSAGTPVYPPFAASNICRGPA